MVATDACSCATCDSSAMVTLSRKRRCTRVLTVRRNHVAAADTPRPTAAPCTMPGLCSRTPLPSSISHNARSASDSAGGSGSIVPGTRSRSGEDVIRRALLFRNDEALRLHVEHRPVAPAERHQLVVRAELEDPAVLEHADAISMAHRGEAMRD